MDAAHARDMRVILDVVINHSGDNWGYNPDVPFFYFKDIQFPLGQFRRADRPVPLELQNPHFYHRRGQIRNFDASPEAQHGDFFSLKDYDNDIDDPGDPNALSLLDVLTMAHCYWIREADVDGFRMDAVKHFGALAAARFSSTVREYAQSLGKRSFFLFGELIAGDDVIDRYIGPNTAARNGDAPVFFGLDSVLDFPLYFVLADVLKGFQPPQNLINRYEAQRNRALSRGQLGQYLVTFLDNHDQVGKDPKSRFGPLAYHYFVILLFGAVMFILIRNLVKSRVGRAIIAQRDNQTSAATSGVNLAVLKTLTFGLSAAVAGVAGSLLMIGPAFISQAPDAYWAIALFCIGGFAHQMLSGALITLSADLFPHHQVATANGMTGTAAWTGGLLFSLLVGGLANTIGYNPLFVCLAVFDLVGATIVISLLRSRDAVGAH